ncbi:Stk1 family PASTA domain-containing Ser/Thr kinase [Halarsenatibacter silvermanii]|uniref:non-specific serine/threonine protein kinase n=1 Tax=Halarsenatibacter silvermanii TaxID=321763 RepID=A0A1G9JIP0_9FIRM|nr:Stk1 family PASTA domain-containing Ser/Thr kinase [Halarsenatibacter silvermanii]SDL37358.1 serine/threonine protein kinase [Halarsenatibacter silvermanii]
MKKKLEDRYKINEVIGRGGMAIVYQATDLLLDRPVAIKMLKKEYITDDSFVERMRREARAVARLSHPNIVDIYDIGQSGDHHYLIMELVEGDTLKNLIESEKALSPDSALKIAKQISSALQAAHEKNIIHCDIKPHNILVTENNRIKVTDFGIARAVNTADTMNLTDSIEGSAHYFSPEQARGNKVGPASDIYSLGVVLYEMLKGEVPYTGDTPISIAVQHVQSPLPEIEDEDIPVAAGELLKNSLAKNPEERYSSAGKFKSEIDLALKKLNDKRSGDKKSVEKRDTLKFKSAEGPDRDDVQKRNDRENNEDEEKNSGLSFWKAGLILTISAVVLLGAAFLGYNFFMDVPVVEVPDLIGMEIEHAEEELSDRGLESEIGEDVNHPDIPADHVAEQDPEPGNEIRQLRPVIIYISSGTEKLKIPEVSGLSEREAEIELQNHGFEPGDISYEFSDTYEEGKVAGTVPEADSEKRKGEEIEIIISMGPSPSQVRVPGLLGMEWRDAQEMLRNNNLRLGGVRRVESKRHPEGYIISQSLEVGKRVTAGRGVDVKISSGTTLDEEAEDVNLRTLSFTSAGDEAAEYRILVEDDLGRDLIWQRMIEPERNIEVSVYSKGETHYQIIKEDEIIYSQTFN